MNFLLLPFIGILSVYASIPYEQMGLVRKNCRQGIIDNSFQVMLKSGFQEGDKAEMLVENPSKMIRNIKIMDEKKLTKAKLEVAPWSDSYWPLYKGAIGNRYNDPDFAFEDWKGAFDYITKNPASKLIAKKQFDSLSPAEKYDYFFHVKSNGLTRSNWSEGQQYFNESGSVETWMGLCHGWAAASIMMPEPKKAVEVGTADGRFSFYPSDIKALATLIWAKGEFNSRFVGGRCNSKNPRNDEMGRPIEQDCLDNNPGTWHMAIVNQIGQFKRSFVMDATYDYEVWNQPVNGYSIKYYNPITKTDSAKLDEAIVTRKEFKKDPRSKVRAAKSTHIVGVKMTVQYVVETSPSTEEHQQTAMKAVVYEYDLELNKDLNIIGGEWYSDNHPDFLWVPEKQAFPANDGDTSDKSINLDAVDSEVIEYAKLNAQNELPFGPIGRTLVNQSQESR
jgi:hypothetical protein